MRFQTPGRFTVTWWSFFPYMVLDFRHFWWAGLVFSPWNDEKQPTDWTKRIEQKINKPSRKNNAFIFIPLESTQLYKWEKRFLRYLLSCEGTREILKLVNQVYVSVIRKRRGITLRLEEGRWQVLYLKTLLCFSLFETRQHLFCSDIFFACRRQSCNPTNKTKYVQILIPSQTICPVNKLLFNRSTVLVLDNKRGSVTSPPVGGGGQW